MLVCGVVTEATKDRPVGPTDRHVAIAVPSHVTARTVEPLPSTVGLSDVGVPTELLRSCEGTNSGLAALGLAVLDLLLSFVVHVSALFRLGDVKGLLSQALMCSSIPPMSYPARR